MHKRKEKKNSLRGCPKKHYPQYTPGEGSFRGRNAASASTWRHHRKRRRKWKVTSVLSGVILLSLLNQLLILSSPLRLISRLVDVFSQRVSMGILYYMLRVSTTSQENRQESPPPLRFFLTFAPCNAAQVRRLVSSESALARADYRFASCHVRANKQKKSINKRGYRIRDFHFPFFWIPQILLFFFLSL